MTSDARPFLPEPDPEPAKPVKRQARRALALWVLLIVMFMGIWQFLSPTPEPSGAAPRRQTSHATARARDDADVDRRAVAPKEVCPESTSSWSGVVTVAPLVLIGVFFFLFLRAYTGSRSFNRDEEPGLVALAERRFSSAIEIFEKVAEANAKRPAHAAAARTHLALAQLEAGELDAALATFAKVERSVGLLRSSGVRLRGAQELALVHALLGDLETGQRWADDARKRLAATLDGRTYYASRLSMAEAVLAIRRGDSAGAAALLEKNWLVLRATLDGNSMRVVEVLRAFAEVGGGLRQYNVVQERVLRVQPVTGNELAFLGARWPEMQSFLVSHALVKDAAATGA
jgi:tetratricopeptide (TPR) repeat protein